MSNNPLVSVIIPTYGGGEHLKRALNSVINQTYSKLEIIVVDDNGIGTENQKLTQLRISEFLGEPNIHYVTHPKNLNGAAARNTGVLHSKGSLVAFLDDDDIYYCSNIQSQASILENLSEDYALTYCSSEVYQGDRKVSESHVTMTGWLLYEIMMHKVTIGSSSLVIRRSVFQEFGGFDESFTRHQDWEFSARVATKYKVFAIDSYGFRRYLEFRNNPTSTEKIREYREHYLNKMLPYLNQLSSKQIDDILISNRMDVAIQFFKYDGVRAFLSEYLKLRPGYRGIKAILHRVFIIIRRRKLRITD